MSSEGREGAGDGVRHSVVAVSYGGGAWQESHKMAFYRPFEAITGLEIQSIAWDANYGRLKNDVASGKVKWDVVEVTAAGYVRGVKDEIFEELDLQLDESEFVPNAIQKYGVANVYWSTVLAYKASEFAENPPNSWSDFWDVSTYPGARALYNSPRGNLEFALLADGVRAADLYPLDVDRAFRSLDRIRDHIRVWWEDGSQPVQLVSTGEVALSSAWNGRIFAALVDSVDIRWSWVGAANDLDYWVVPRGVKNKEWAQRLIWYMSQAHSMAIQAEMVGYGPSNIGAMKYLGPETAKLLPTEPGNWSQGFVVDSDWWADHEEDVKRRWVEWKAGFGG